MSYLACDPTPLQEKNRRYWLFCFNIAEACGGIEDLFDTYDELADALSEAEKQHGRGYDCLHVIDIQTMNMVANLYHGVGPDGKDHG